MKSRLKLKTELAYPLLELNVLLCSCLFIWIFDVYLWPQDIGFGFIQCLLESIPVLWNFDFRPRAQKLIWIWFFLDICFHCGFFSYVHISNSDWYNICCSCSGVVPSCNKTEGEIPFTDEIVSFENSCDSSVIGESPYSLQRPFIFLVFI